MTILHFKVITYPHSIIPLDVLDRTHIYLIKASFVQSKLDFVKDTIRDPPLPVTVPCHFQTLSLITQRKRVTAKVNEHTEGPSTVILMPSAQIMES